MTAVVPYVPTDELPFLPRDVVAHEPAHALDGGPGGMSMLIRVAEVVPRWLRPGGSVLMELGGDQFDEVATALAEGGFDAICAHRDGDEQDRAIEARRSA